MKLYYAPVSTYSQKALTALYEKELTFERNLVNIGDKSAKETYRKEVYPLGKVPLLVRDDGWKIPESTIIIEYLDANFDSGTRLIPDDPERARQVRFMDRMCDLYLNDPIVTLLFQSWKPEEKRDAERIDNARFKAGVMYQFMDKTLQDKEWLMGEFSMADCAAAPGLLYAERLFPFDDYPAIEAYWERISGRPSYREVLAEVLPFLENL